MVMLMSGVGELGLVLFAYFAPSIIAASRHCKTGPVIVINLLLGWTFVGWVVALAMAVSTPDAEKRPTPTTR